MNVVPSNFSSGQMTSNKCNPHLLIREREKYGDGTSMKYEQNQIFFNMVMQWLIYLSSKPIGKYVET